MIRTTRAIVPLMFWTAAAATAVARQTPPARTTAISARTGSVEPNMEADLIAVDGNPLERIWIVQNPLLVISNGQIALNALDPSK